jgi:hypothetical protein
MADLLKVKPNRGNMNYAERQWSVDRIREFWAKTL